MPVSRLHYDLSHQLLLDAADDRADPTRTVRPQKRLYLDFIDACRSPEKRLLEPFPERLDAQCRSGNFVPHQCLRHLAMIESVNKSYTDFPLLHDALLREVSRCRASEESQCQVLSEMHEAAVQRLIQYSRHDDGAYANARFLDLTEPFSQDGESKVKRVQSDVAAQAAVRRMVEKLAQVFDKEGIDMTVFRPNHFATLSVYYAKFLRIDNARSHNGLARWCFGLKKFVRGEEIEPEAERRQHLASQCLPRHFDDGGGSRSGGSHLVVLERSCQAIASAPVTCELCHVGLAGHDKLAEHCRQKHKGLAEYRKRTFYKAREAGICPLLPWVKRNMAQSFQFFRLHSVPSSCNDWTMKASQKPCLSKRPVRCASVRRRGSSQY